MARLLLGVSGGISAYKALEAARLAVKAGHSVRVIQTEASERFVGRASFEAITGAPVLVSEFERDPARGAFPGEPVPERTPISHLALVEHADVFLIAPASANTLAKLAGGHADNLLSAAALAAPCPVIVAPAMNARMYAHPATQANVAALAARGVLVLEPAEGELASHGEYGVGRLVEPAQLIEACEAVLARAPDAIPHAEWAGTRVLVSAGGTREPIDSVRYIGNRSSGRMGLALAARAAARGAEVTLVAANVSLPAPAGVRTIAVVTADELRDACLTEFPGCDVLLMAAAVADFRPAAPVSHKLKKSDGSMPAVLELEATDDVLSALSASRRPDQTLVGFAAEHGEGALAYAQGKLAAKGLDLIVVNDISREDIGFEGPDNEVVILSADREQSVPRASKEQVADAVLDEVARRRAVDREASEENPGGGTRAHTRSASRI